MPTTCSGGRVVSSGPEALAAARRVADAVLYEGYVLFPYRASALKNRYRWQWGVVVPQAQAELGASEPSTVACHVALRAPVGARVSVSARFLHLQLRQMQDASGTPVDELVVDGVAQPTWEEGVEHEVTTALTLAARRGAEERFALPAGQSVEDLGPSGRAVRTTWPVTGALEVDVEQAGDDVWRLGVTVRNDTSWSQRRAARDDVLRRAIVGTHVLLHTDDGAFASVIDPPPWADHDLRQRGLHPVLIGDGVERTHDRPRRTGATVLGAAIILYDHPEIAPESPGPSFDATEVDELLALAVMGLTDDEKRQARATDPRAAELIDRTDTLPDEVRRRLHGTVREWGAGPAALRPDPAAAVPDEVRELLGVAEEPQRRVRIGDHEVEVGDHVRLRPARRADAHDLFVAGRAAVVEKIVRTVDGDTYLAVTVSDDPAADLHRWYGRFQYFAVDEVEPLDDDAVAAPARVHDDRVGAEGPTSEGGS